MAVLEIEVAAEEQVRAQREAQQVGLSLSGWVKRRLLGSPPVIFTTDDGEAYETADLSRVTACASEAASTKF